MPFEEGDYAISVLSRRRNLQKPNSIGVLSALLGRGADRRDRVLELARSKVREETGRLSPSHITERHRV